LCSCVAPPGARVHRLTLERRARKYPPRPKANRVVRHHKGHHTDDPGGKGQEIVREVVVCPECAGRNGAT
jgi:hypothetical protein